MNNEQAGIFIKAVYHYQITGELMELDFGLKMAIAPFINQFKRDEEKYQNTVERNKINGSKGGRPINPTKPKETQKTHSVNSKPKKADNDNVNDNVKESKKEKIAPTLLEVKDYFTENGYTQDSAIRAFNYYEVGNWHDSKGNKVKNWKQKMQSVWFKPENKIVTPQLQSITSEHKWFK